MGLSIDFNDWNAMKVDWAEAAFQYNTGRNYQHKQGLVALFGNSFNYYKHKFETYFDEFKVLPKNYIDDLIFDFRQHFPIHGRIEGINYFDDLLILLIEKYEKVLPPQQTENIDWLEIFETIDIENPIEPQAYNTTTLEQKKTYFSRASFNLTLQYLHQLKRETFFLSKNRKIEYLNSLNITSPKIGNSESPLFNQTGFEAQCNYYEFVIRYKAFLEGKTQTTLPQTETKTEQETPNFKNNFDKITPKEIYQHFKAGLVDKGYLTEKELNEYLKAAFELKTIPETLFKIKDAPNKAAIEAVFYKYYKNVAGKIHGTQNQYAALLGNYFEGYKTTTVSSNFSKSVY